MVGVYPIHGAIGVSLGKPTANRLLLLGECDLIVGLITFVGLVNYRPLKGTA